jgi:ubiquitin C-terminal hydrolase
MKHSNIQNMQTKYRLKGVVIHTGTSVGGHYYSLIRNNNAEGWLKFNDQNVVEF